MPRKTHSHFYTESMMRFELRSMHNRLRNARIHLEGYRRDARPMVQAVNLKWLRHWYRQFNESQANAIGWASR